MTAHLSAPRIHRADGPSEKATLQSTFLEKTGNLHISFRPKEREKERERNHLIRNKGLKRKREKNFQSL